MYNLLIGWKCFLIVVSVIVSSGSKSEVCTRTLLFKIRSFVKNIAVLVEAKGRFGNVKIQEKVQLEAYSLTFKDTLDEKNFEALEDLEPLSPCLLYTSPSPRDLP